MTLPTSSRPRYRSSLWLFAGILGFTTLLACDPKERGTKEDADAGGDMSAAVLGDAGESLISMEAPEETDKPKAEDIQPEFYTYGTAKVVPSELVVRSAVPLVNNRYDPLDRDKNTLIFTPEVKGSLERTSDTALNFVPEKGFEPDTTYNVRLSAVSAFDEMLTPETPWTYSFTTPKFEFLDMSTPLRTGEDSIVTTLYFSAPAKLDELDKFTTWKISGKKPTNVKYSYGTTKDQIVATIIDRTLKQTRDHTLDLALAAGVLYSDTIKTREAAKRSATILEGEPMEIMATFKQEGSSGFYVDVICNDKADPGNERYYWDRVNYNDYYISPTCMPDLASAQKHITFNPKIDFDISQSAGGFRIFGDFKQGSYTMNIAPGLMTQKGGLLRESFQKNLEIPAREPSINFTSKGRFIPTEAWDRLAVRHLNVEKFGITIKHIPLQNINFWLSGSDETATERVANVVVRKNLELKQKEDIESVTWLDMPSMIADPKPGIYEISLTNDIHEDLEPKTPSTRSSRTKIVQDATRLLITDLNLIAKRSATAPGKPFSDEIHVWTIGMQDIKPRAGVEVQAIRPSGDVLARCKTDLQGGCVLNVRTDGVDKTPPFALVASKDDDFTYITFSQLATQHTESGISGTPYLTEETYTAAIYGDRDLYRPAGQVHLAAALRQQDSWRAPKKEVPVEVVMRDARSRVVLRKVIKTNAAGALAIDYQLGDYAPTGRWNVELKVGKKQVATYGFSVEEFVPERMRVKAKFKKEDHFAGDALSVNVKAKYLFGGSAEGSAVEMKCTIQPSDFMPEKNAEYTYGSDLLHEDVKAIELGRADDEIGADDTLDLDCPTPELSQKLEVPAEVVAHVSVFEAGSGRTTSRTVSAPLHPAPYYLGLKTSTEEAKEGKALAIEGIVVTPSGEPTSQVKEVELELIRMVSEYGWSYDEDYGYERYTWYRRQVPEGKQTVKVKANGTFTASVTPREEGEAFIVRVRSKDEVVTDLEVAGRSRYYYWYGDSSSNNTPSPQKAASVKITPPKSLVVGDVAELSFDAPFKGRALLTIETHEVIKKEWREVEPGENKFTFKLKTFQPNVYFSAFIVKDPHLDSKDAFLPGRALGIASMKVTPTEYTHNVKIKTPREVRSESKLEVELDLGQQTEQTFVTVAVVDEGILSLTKYLTPDLREKLFTRRALGVDTFDTVGWGLQLESMHGKAGGGDEYDEEEPEMDASGEDSAGLGRPKAIKPVALWSGLVEVPKSGRLTVPFDLPLYRGSLRVMVSAVSASKVGHAESEVLVRDPINIQSTLPRFLSGGDEVHVPVFITNTSGSKQTINVSFNAEEQPIEGISKATLPPTPLVTLINEGAQSLSLEDGKSGTVVFRVKALRQAGVAKFNVNATAGDLKSRDEAIVPFIPSGPRERKVTRLTIEDTLTDLTQVLEGWEPTSEHTTFWLTTLPYGEAFDHLKFLVRYPYGCVEQTTSSTRPLLFVGDILEQVAPSIAPKPEEVTKMVNHGIRRIFSMQTSSGGFGYWPGSRYPNAWGTAYASHMLLDAREAGYDVNARRLDDALDWLADNADRSSYSYAEPYIQYVLARADRGQKGRIKKLLALMPKEPTGEDAEKVYLLKAALYQLGDRRYESDLKSPDVSSLSETRRYGYSYYSDRRRRAMMLNTFYELFGADPKGEALMNLVGRSLSERASYWYTTQELVWGVTALGKWSKGNSTSIGKAELLVNNSPFAAIKSGGKRPDMTWSLMRASEYDAMQLRLDKKPEGKLYLVVSSEGVRTNPELTYGGDGIALTRTYYDTEGNLLSLSDIELGDVVYSQLRITNKTNSTIENVALVERFPAGWEVENPNLNGESIPQNLLADAWGYEHMNVRDDRVEAFNTLNANQSATLTIALRATSAGVFTSPSASAEAMYDPSKWARVKPIELKILGPWED